MLHGWSFWGRQKEETELREGLGEVGGRSEKIAQANERNGEAINGIIHPL